MSNPLNQTINPDTTKLPSANTKMPSANLARRLAALVYDAFLLFAITLAYGLLLLLIKVIFNGTQGLEEVQPSPVLQWLSSAGLLVTLAGYYFVCWRKQGQTLGMKSWRLRLQQTDGSLATPEQCIKRSIMATLSLGLFGIGYLWCLIAPAKATLHDIYSGTEVVLLPPTK
tara:strand:- start:4600 stop:5112 length:513 start_codon:yes stop_codon:yes gene_type:complete